MDNCEFDNATKNAQINRSPKIEHSGPPRPRPRCGGSWAKKSLSFSAAAPPPRQTLKKQGFYDSQKKVINNA